MDSEALATIEMETSTQVSFASSETFLLGLASVVRSFQDRFRRRFKSVVLFVSKRKDIFSHIVTIPLLVTLKDSEKWVLSLLLKAMTVL